MSYLKELKLKTEDEGAYDITRQVSLAIEESGVLEGIAIIFCPHTTAAITITENTDPNVTDDMLHGIKQAFPDRPEYKHFEGNSFAHIKSSVVGVNLQLIVTGGWPLLGPFQAIYFLEFDGPRERRFVVKVIEC